MPIKDTAFFIGGGASFTTYAGVFFLKERPNLIKLLSTFLTVLGAAILWYAKN